MHPTPDPRDGSMADINAAPMPGAQAEVYAIVPDGWAWVPRVGVPDLVLRALRDRGIVETVWCTGGQQWRRLPSPPKVE